MASYSEGDQVEVEAPGSFFHGHWGVVEKVDGDAVWVELRENSRIFGDDTPMQFPMRFNPWELRVLKLASDERGTT